MSRSFEFDGCTEEELWRFVASHLTRRGIEVVLVGGAVVAVYTGGAYQSDDLDLVRVSYLGPDLEVVMGELGFAKQGRFYAHPDCSHLFVEFPSGPLGIGADSGIEPCELSEGECRLKLLSPTDCVKDRLASYIHFAARECLDQAVLVAQNHDVDWDCVETWCRGEGERGPEAFVALKRLLGID